MPEISVICPVYNAEKHLARAVKSVLAQTFGDFELILVDDGSTDGSGELCDEFAAEDKRVRVIHKANGGTSSARNAGLSAARGEYVTFVDNDDYCAPTLLERLCGAASGRDVVKCMFYNVRDYSGNDPEELRKHITSTMTYPAGEYNARGFMQAILHYHGIFITVWTLAVKRSLAQSIGFPENRGGEDAAFVRLLAEKAQSFYVLDEPLYYWVAYPDSQCHDASMQYRLSLAEEYMNMFDTVCKKGDEQLMGMAYNRVMWAFLICVPGKKSSEEAERYSRLRDFLRKNSRLLDKSQQFPQGYFSARLFLFSEPLYKACMRLYRLIKGLRSRTR